MLAYGSGLRLSELCHLRVADIDSHADRMCIRVVQGKVGKDRYVPLSADVLELLREWWRLQRPRQRLFPGQGDGLRPISDASAQKWYYGARAAAGITKQDGIHTLRHCYATHLLETGVDLFSLSRWLGHQHVSTTGRYLHLVQPDVPDRARRRHLEGIVACAQTRQTNGFREAINGVFQAANRRARGFGRLSIIKTVIFLIAGKLDFTAINTHVR
jgi:integrase